MGQGVSQAVDAPETGYYEAVSSSDGNRAHRLVVPTPGGETFGVLLLSPANDVKHARRRSTGLSTDNRTASTRAD